MQNKQYAGDQENISIKSIERIARILGNQYKILSIISDRF